MTAGALRTAAAAWLVMAGMGLAQVAEVETRAPDPAKVKAEFEAARQQEKDLIAELTLLQAEYQEPKSDKKAVVAKFEAARQKIPATKERLETAAFALALAEPKNPAARELCGLVIASRLQSDDPAEALRLADLLEKAGTADGNIDMVAATAAMVLSRLDDAVAWLAKAETHGMDKQKLAELQSAIDDERPKVESEMARRKKDAEADDLPRVEITTSKGRVVVELFEDDAPNTVANFISLVEKGFYDGTPFHRVIGGFMAQGGDPTGTGSGGPGHVIECECQLPAARKHFLGSLSMAHAGKNTGGSQFFLTFRPTEHLDGKHTVFGRVVEGFDVLPRLTRTQSGDGRSNSGVKPDTILAAKVLRKRNHDYAPKTLPDPRK
ncbi:MAG: peptidylprolyl isomerase [Planctomycetia bacterium]